MRRREFITLLGGAAALAARGARAAARAHAAHRRAAGFRRGRVGHPGAARGFPAANRAARMVGRPKRPHRHSLCGRQGRPISEARERAGRPGARRDPRPLPADHCGAAAREPRDPDRLRLRVRPDRCRHRRKPGATGWQCDGPDAVRGGHHRQVAGDAQGDRAALGTRCARGQP